MASVLFEGFDLDSEEYADFIFDNTYQQLFTTIILRFDINFLFSLAKLEQNLPSNQRSRTPNKRSLKKKSKSKLD